MFFASNVRLSIQQRRYIETTNAAAPVVGALPVIGNGIGPDGRSDLEAVTFSLIVIFVECLTSLRDRLSRRIRTAGRADSPPIFMARNRTLIFGWRMWAVWSAQELVSPVTMRTVILESAICTEPLFRRNLLNRVRLVLCECCVACPRVATYPEVLTHEVALPASVGPCDMNRT